MTATFPDLQSTLSECLTDKSLQLQVKSMGSQLSIMINRPQNEAEVDYQAISDKLLTKLRSLNLPNVNSVKLYGRMANTQKIEWQLNQTLEASNPAANSAIASPPNATNSTASQKPKTKFQTYLEQFSHYSNVISAASLLGLLVLLGFNTLAGQKTQAAVYEYKIESVNDLIFTETMNTMGTQGWELVFARRAKDSSTDDFAYEIILKRVKK
ncbi:MAG: hypothetical protein J0L70_11105 [Leptolyngbya sp. UWPOB_LEPTO1]|uniref:hypothetical protein n=1 Tax=Leptolyngbya sp. UWPOB_LEPTO1 TaxID=2815653 RepID=UPI001AC09EA6|nr:hypothetical protein [Leptolyngbya sp. UWPOB_LEPTO1]MBN8561064.1 hypothetical protein [Leptolyngbya sp. UWPOB_LEPTO1]